MKTTARLTNEEWLKAMREASRHLGIAYSIMERAWEQDGSPAYGDYDESVDRCMWMTGIAQELADDAVDSYETEVEADKKEEE